MSNSSVRLGQPENSDGWDAKDPKWFHILNMLREWFDEETSGTVLTASVEAQDLLNMYHAVAGLLPFGAKQREVRNAFSLVVSNTVREHILPEITADDIAAALSGEGWVPEVAEQLPHTFSSLDLKPKTLTLSYSDMVTLRDAFWRLRKLEKTIGEVYDFFQQAQIEDSCMTREEVEAAYARITNALDGIVQSE